LVGVEKRGGLNDFTIKGGAMVFKDCFLCGLIWHDIDIGGEMKTR